MANELTDVQHRTVLKAGAVLYYGGYAGFGLVGEIIPEGKQQGLTDLLSDMMQLAQYYELDFHAALEQAGVVESKPANMLVIRDPDWENSYTTDEPVNVITIDIGGSWNGYKYFAAALQEGEEEAVDYERTMLTEVADLDPSNTVRTAVEAYFNEARGAS